MTEQTTTSSAARETGPPQSPLRETVRRAFDERAMRRVYELGEKAQASDTPLCFSLYLPMAAANPEHNWLQLKNGIAAFERELDDEQASEEQQENYRDMMRSVRTLLSKDRILKMADGTLGLFACSEGTEMFFFDTAHPMRSTVASYFDLVPFAQLSRGMQPLYLLALTQTSLRVYQLHGQQFERVGGGRIPDRLEDVLGYELGQDGIKGHMGQRATSEREGMIFHGHGAGSEKEKKKETLQYFSRIDDELCSVVGRDEALMLMGTPEIVALFRQQTALRDAQIETVIQGSPAHLDEAALKQKALEARASLQEKWARDEADDLSERIERNELVTNPSKLAAAAREGRILALYVGEKMAKSRRSAGKHARKVIDLSNRSVAELARQVMRLGGHVRSLPPGFRTPHGARVAAVLRY